METPSRHSMSRELQEEQTLRLISWLWVPIIEHHTPSVSAFFTGSSGAGLWRPQANQRVLLVRS